MSKIVGMVTMSGPPKMLIFEFTNSHGESVVTMDDAGKLTFGPGYTPDAAADHFWEKVSTLLMSSQFLGAYLHTVDKTVDFMRLLKSV